VFFVCALLVRAADLATQIDPIFAEFAKPGSPGCAVSVTQNGELVFAKGYGFANLDHGVPITPKTVFHVASVSKQFTAAAILMLAQDGKLSLDDEVQKYVPELPYLGAPVTLRHMLRHTSGIRDQWDLLSLTGWLYSRDRITDDDVLNVLSRQRDLNFKPGSEYLYSNSGFTLAAIIVKRVSGESLRQFTTRRIFEPLGMKQTFFRDRFGETIPGLATGYVESDGKWLKADTNFDTAGATSLHTTVEDLSKWETNFWSGKAGGAEFLKTFLTPGALPQPPSNMTYGYGLQHSNHRGQPTIEHSGGDAGFRAHFLRLPQLKLGIAAACNAGTANPSRLTRRVADVIAPDAFSEPVPPAPAEVKPPAGKWQPAASELADYAGQWIASELQVTYRAEVKDGKLVLSGPKSVSRTLEPFEKDTFRADGTQYRFRRDGKGAVQTLVTDGGRVRGLLWQRASAPLVVFVVDDNDRRTRILARILESRYGVRTYVARAGREVDMLDIANLAVFAVPGLQLPEPQRRVVERYLESGKRSISFGKQDVGATSSLVRVTSADLANESTRQTALSAILSVLDRKVAKPDASYVVDYEKLQP
jgi:CubicO group peptidase (beta-lactamase class C family)